MAEPPKKYRSDFLKTCTSIGKKKGRNYIPSSTCKTTLAEILDYFKVENQYHEFAWKYFGKWNIFGTDVIPLVMKTKELSPFVLDSILDIMQIITLTPYDDYENPVPNIVEKQIVKGLLQQHKIKILASGMIGILSLRILDINEQSQREFLELEGRSLREHYQRRKIFRNKYRFHNKLFRVVNNLLCIKLPKNSSFTHEKFVTSLSECNFFGTLLNTTTSMVNYVSSLSPGEHSLYQSDLVLFLGIVNGIFGNEDAEELCRAIDKGGIGDVEKYNRFMLAKIMKKEKLQKKRHAKNLPSRHSRFGGHMTQKLSDGSKVGVKLGGRRVANPSASKGRYNRWRVVEQPIKRNVSSIETKRLLRSFGEKIIDELWNEYFNIVKSLFFKAVDTDGDHMEDVDDHSNVNVSIKEHVWFIKTCQILLSINRYRDLRALKIDRVVCVFQRDMVEYIFESLDMFITQKFTTAQRYLIHFMKTYMCCIDDMYHSWNRCKKNSPHYNVNLKRQSTKVLAFIILEQRRFNHVLKLLKGYKVSRNPKAFLYDCFITMYYFFDLVKTSHGEEHYHVRKQTRKKVVDIEDTGPSEELLLQKKQEGMMMADEDEEEAIQMMQELQNDNTKRLDLMKLQKKFCHSVILKNFHMCLDSFLLNSTELNYALYKLMRMIIVDLKQPMQFYQLSYMNLFSRIIHDPYYNPVKTKKRRRRSLKRQNKLNRRRRSSIKFKNNIKMTDEDEEEEESSSSSDSDSDDSDDEDEDMEFEKDERMEVNKKLVRMCEKITKEFFQQFKNPEKTEGDVLCNVLRVSLWEPHRHFPNDALLAEEEDVDNLDAEDNAPFDAGRYKGEEEEDSDDEQTDIEEDINTPTKKKKKKKKKNKMSSDLSSLFGRPGQPNKKKYVRKSNEELKRRINRLEVNNNNNNEEEEEDDDVTMIMNEEKQQQQQQQPEEEKTAEDEVNEFMKEQEAIGERLRKLLGKTKNLETLRQEKVKKMKNEKNILPSTTTTTTDSQQVVIIPPPPISTSSSSSNSNSNSNEIIPPPPLPVLQKKKKKKNKKIIKPDFSLDEDEEEEEEEEELNSTTTTKKKKKRKTRLDITKEIERELKEYEEEKLQTQKEEREQKQIAEAGEDIQKWRQMLSPSASSSSSSTTKKKKKKRLSMPQKNDYGEVLKFDEDEDDDFEMKEEEEDRKRKRDEENEVLDKLKKRKKRKII